MLEAFPPAPISTGSAALDQALGNDSLLGGVIEIFGPAGSGKTSLGQYLAAGCQRLGRPAAWIDCDHSFDPAYARRCQVDPAQLYLANPGWLEAALDMTGCLLESGLLGLVVLDGLDRLPDLHEQHSPLNVQPDWEDQPADYRPMLSPWLRRLKPILRQWQSSLVITHQGPIGGAAPISQAYHALAGNLGRLALPLQATLRIQLEPGALLYRSPKKEVIGQRMQARILKHPLKTTVQIAEFDIMYSQGYPMKQ